MEVSCDKCDYKGRIKDELIPEGGRNLKCPKCKSVFFVKRPIPEKIETSYRIEEETETRPVDRVETFVDKGHFNRNNKSTKKVNVSITRLSAILSGSICIITGFYLLTVQPAADTGNVMFTICHGMGAYFIGKGLYVGTALWNYADLREKK